MRTGLCSCLSLLQQGNETMADRLLVLVPHAHTHAPRSILEQARKLGPDVSEMRANKHTMELIAQSLCIANGAPAKVARGGWPGKTAPLTGQSMGTKSELHQSSDCDVAKENVGFGAITHRRISCSCALYSNWLLTKVAVVVQLTTMLRLTISILRQISWARPLPCWTRQAMALFGTPSTM